MRRRESGFKSKEGWHRRLLSSDRFLAGFSEMLRFSIFTRL